MNELSANVMGSVRIGAGLQDWQIFQQMDGAGDITVSGDWWCKNPDGSEAVHLRLVDENTGLVVRQFTPAATRSETTLPDGGVEGRWHTVLAGVPAGGLYRLESCLYSKSCEGLEWAHRGDMRHHLGVGDLYAIAGQSNAVGFGRDPIPDPPEPGVHMLRHSGVWSLACHPLADSTDTSLPILTERINPAHSPYLAFAKLVRQRTGYPIGLLPLAKGGSALARWNPDETGDLYANLLDCIRGAGGHIRGVLWYQGSADAGSMEAAASYYDRFARFVQCLRSDLDMPHLPLFTMQLNRYVADLPQAMDEEWCIVREAQRQAARRIPDVYIAPAGDALLSDLIHNAAATNLMLGQRLANLALKNIYGFDIHCQAPDLSKAVLEAPDRVRLEFDHVLQQLSARKAPASSLALRVQDALGDCNITDYTIWRNQFTLHLSRALVENGSVGCLYGRAPCGQVPFDTWTNLPVLAFCHIPIINDTVF